MDVERRLITACARLQDMDPLLAYPIEPNHFRQREYGDKTPEPTPGEVYEWLLEHRRRFRCVPSIDLLQSRFPLFQLSDTNDGVGPLLEEFLRSINRLAAIPLLRELAGAVDDPSRQLDLPELFFQKAREIAQVVPTDRITRFSEDALTTLDLYRIRAESGENPGISTAMRWLDDYTYGLQSHEMMIVTAFLGQKKSTYCLAVCADAYFVNGKTPMFFSLEMEDHKLTQRWIAKAAGISYGAMKRPSQGKLSDDDLRRWEEVAQRASEANVDKDILMLDKERRPTVDYIFSMVETYRPDFVVVDTIDKIQAPSWCKSSYERGYWAASELKAIARSARVPVIAIAQANRGAAETGATLDTIADSIAIAREADIGLGLHATNEMKQQHMCEFSLLKNRDDRGEGTKRNMYFHPGTMELRDWQPNDAVATKS